MPDKHSAVCCSLHITDRTPFSLGFQRL